jgi:hypothetical protein
MWVITPTRGLMAPDAPVTADVLREFAEVDVDPDDARYRDPLDRDVRELRRVLSSDASVVLLGSIATAKYVDVLSVVFGERLCFPQEFVGRGDMSRGGLMLRSVAANVELAYTALSPGVRRRGGRPPRLTPAVQDRHAGRAG